MFVSRFFSRGLLLALAAISPLVHAADDGASKDKKPPATVRFLLMGVLRPNRYAPVGKSGMVSIVPTPPQELPPSALYDKGPGGDYKDLRISAQVVSEPLIIVKPPTEYTLYEKIEAPAVPAGGGNSKPKPTWKPALTFPIVSTHQIVCFYQTGLTGDWSPPKMTVIDIAKDKLPDDAVIVMNALRTSALVQIGVRARPVSLNPGGYAIMPVANDESGAAPLKVARNLGEGKYAVIANTSRVFPKGMRCLIMISEQNPKIAGQDAEINMLRFPPLE